MERLVHTGCSLAGQHRVPAAKSTDLDHSCLLLDLLQVVLLQVIAYNLCFSTCLGRPQHAAATSPLQLGVAQGHLPGGTLAGPLQPDR